MKTKAKRELLREARNLGFIDDGKPDRSGCGVYFLTCTRHGRRLHLQIWGDGRHRVSHGTLTTSGSSHQTTEPTNFTNLTGMYRSIAFEWQRPSYITP